MNVLIPTMPDDTHAIYVNLALKKLGHKSCIWYMADFPTQQTHSFEIKNGNAFYSSTGCDFDIYHQPFDVVWFRRPRRPIISEAICQEDRKNAMKENMAIYDTFQHIIAPNARWVNPLNSVLKANCKLLQLKIAVQVGLKIPATIISNDPVKIKAFIKSNKKEEVIYKPLAPTAWIENDKIKLTYTKVITPDNLPSDFILQMTPGIFQKKINKNFELRITMMGNHPVAIKINSQEHSKGVIDWRYVPTHELSIEQFDLSPDITKKCIALMKELGIVFGCFDFIVTPDGDYYFLEVNEQGQFLWIEDINPDLKILGKFVNFLINNEKPCDELLVDVTMQELTTEVKKNRTLAMQLHKNPPSF